MTTSASGFASSQSDAEVEAVDGHERRGTVVAPIFAVSQDPSYLDGFLSGMTATAYARPWA